MIKNGVLARHVASATALAVAIARFLQFAAAEALSKHVCQEQGGVSGSSIKCPLVKASKLPSNALSFGHLLGPAGVAIGR